MCMHVCVQIERVTQLHLLHVHACMYACTTAASNFCLASSRVVLVVTYACMHVCMYVQHVCSMYAYACTTAASNFCLASSRSSRSRYFMKKATVAASLK